MDIDIDRARQLIRQPTAWQRVLHGDVLDLREHVFEELIHHGSAKTAFRYATCGCGDQIVQVQETCRVQPRGCGHRLCPRCGRKRGGRLARRVIGWLAAEAHGELWAVCLTQQVRCNESLTDARKRMEVKHRSYLRWLTRKGLIAAMSSAHVVWSVGQHGWHYHVHVLAEMPAGAVDQRALIDQMAVGFADVGGSKEMAVRKVCDAGPAIASLSGDNGSLDYWIEDADPVARAVQYPVRDMCQGVSAWRMGGDVDRVRASVRSMLVESKGWKLSRAWGRWRKTCPTAVQKPLEEATEAETEVTGTAPCPSKALGQVGRLYWAARRGGEWERRVFVALERSVFNSGDFAKRFVAFCRRAATGVPFAGDDRCRSPR